MVFAVADGMTPREEVLALFGSLFTGNEAAPDSAFWSLLASSVCDLYPEELMEVIKEAFREGLISSWVIGIPSFECTLEGNKEQALEQVRAEIRRRSLENVHDYMSWWAKQKAVRPGPRIKHSDEKLQQSLVSFDEFNLKCNDAKQAWDKVAKHHGFVSWTAARQACYRFRQRRNK